jgi:hypothetical protein
VTSDELARLDAVREAATSAAVVLPVLGIPVRFESNDATVIEVVEEAFGIWRAVEGRPDLMADRRVHVRCVVRDGVEGPGPHAPLAYEMPVHERVVLRTPGSLGVADALTGEACATVTRSLVSDRAHFRYGVLEALTLALLTRFDRQPLHAAALVRGSAALLLAGSAGVGKSTLAYAALRAGIEVLTDDAVYVQLDPELRVWGVPGHLHLPVDAMRWFPELSGATATLLASGKQKVAVRAASPGSIPLPLVERPGLCVLRRGDLGPGLVAVSGAVLAAELQARLEEGFDVFARTIRTAVERLAQRGGWVLNVPGRPQAALPFLHSMLDVVNATP